MVHGRGAPPPELGVARSRRVRRFRIADPPQSVESLLGAGHNLFRFSNLNKRDTRHCFPARMCSQGTVETCCLASQVSNFKRSSCRKRHGQLIFVLDLGLRPNDHNRHRARCRSSASTSDEHVSLCASRAAAAPAAASISVGRTPPRVPTAPTATRRTSSVFRCAATASPPGRCRAISSTRAPPPTPTRLRSALDLRPPRSPPLPGARLRITRAELTIGAKAVRSWQGFPCAVNPGGLSGSPGAVG